jgi:DNA-binding NarL/FixJ family response regulator
MAEEAGPEAREQQRELLARLDVLCVEDDPEVLELLAAFLRARCRTVYEARDGVAGLALFRSARPHLVLTDIRMPKLDGLGMAAAIRELDAQVPILLTSAYEEVASFKRALDLGVETFVEKPPDPEQLDRALLACAARLQADAGRSPQGAKVQGGRPLAPREREVLRLVAEGLSSKEIARSMGIALSTVETHRKNIMDKLSLGSVAELTKYALRAGLTTLED